MLSDLQDSFEYFAKGNMLISRADFESIIHNFGYKRLNPREKDTELSRIDPHLNERTGFSFDFLKHVVNYRWTKGDERG